VATAARTALLVALTCVAIPLSLLHSRMGHQSGSGWNAAVKDGRVKGIKLSTHSIRGRCDSCLKGSMHRASFPDQTEKFQQLQIPDDMLKGIGPAQRKPFQRVGLDGVGPMEQHALGGYTGFYTFVCMHTMAIWVELYQQPRQAYQIIRDFANTVKTKFRSEIREIHTDQHPLWGEKCHEWEAVRSEIGCNVTYSTVYTPEQNRSAERANGSVLACARTMFEEVLGIRRQVCLRHSYVRSTHKATRQDTAREDHWKIARHHAIQDLRLHCLGSSTQAETSEVGPEGCQRHLRRLVSQQGRLPHPRQRDNTQSTSGDCAHCVRRIRVRRTSTYDH